MGPRPDDRGYVVRAWLHSPQHFALQWVHGLMTVVMCTLNPGRACGVWLQWVHGLMTVVMHKTILRLTHSKMLQWVHGLMTVVMY